MRTIEELVEAIHQEALRASFPIDTPVYELAKRDPTIPILFAGSLDASVCILARDLGKDEVAAAQPLIGAGGRLVRSGLYLASRGQPPPPGDRRLESVLPLALLTNTVPYKPPGNKAYAPAVKARFRPFLAELLASHWRGGNQVLTLGTEAFQWFTPYSANADAFAEFWKRDDRYESQIDCEIVIQTNEVSVRKPLSILPLPHPSPLNQRWYKHFPALLANRLAQLSLRPV